MGASLNALGILLSAFLGAAAVIWFRGGSSTRWAPWLQIVMGIAAFAAAFVLPIEVSDVPMPRLQALVPLAAIVLTSVAVRRHLPRLGMLAVQVALCVALCDQFVDMAGHRGWSGETDPERTLARSRRMALLRAWQLVGGMRADVAQESLPEGWIDRPPLVDRLFPSADDRAILSGLPTEIESAHAEWHTWLTGLYRIHTRPAAVWFPGGRMADAKGRLELRPRPGTGS